MTCSISPDYIIEAYLFAAQKPVPLKTLESLVHVDVPVEDILYELQMHYENRGINLRVHNESYCFVTNPKLENALAQFKVEPKKLSRSALETLAIIAYHQPCTRAEIEDIRGVSLARGTLDVLVEAGFVRMRGRRKVLGRPLTYGTTTQFLQHFGLESLSDLPGLMDLQNLGLLQDVDDAALSIPMPSNDQGILPEEEPLENDFGDLPPLEDE